LQRVPATPQLEHHLLRDLLGRGPLADDPFSHSYESRVVRAKDDVERAFVPCPDSLLKVALGRVVPIQGG